MVFAGLYHNCGPNLWIPANPFYYHPFHHRQIYIGQVVDVEAAEAGLEFARVFEGGGILIDVVAEIDREVGFAG